MHWIFLLLILGWLVFCVFVSLVVRRLPGPARFLFIVMVLGGLVIGGYGFGEFVINKGPDDWGSIWHAGYPLAEKYGKYQTEASYEMKTFDKDPDSSGSGTYHVHFKYDDHTGVVLSHYDKPTGKFDHDEIVPDK